jgi:hypothetical protein
LPRIGKPVGSGGYRFFGRSKARKMRSDNIATNNPGVETEIIVLGWLSGMLSWNATGEKRSVWVRFYTLVLSRKSDKGGRGSH